MNENSTAGGPMDERTNPDEQPAAGAQDLDEQSLPLQPEADPRGNEDEVQEASEDSFPASDPPSFTGTTTD
jgi:hypothetical protein